MAVFLDWFWSEENPSKNFTPSPVQMSVSLHLETLFNFPHLCSFIDGLFMLCSFRWRQQLFSKFGVSKQEKKKTLQIYSWMKELSRTCCYVESSSKKKLQIVHIRKLGTCRDCWAQLYDGIPPKKICEHEPKLNSSREHILRVRQEARFQLGKAQAPKMASAKHRDCVAQLFL